MEIIGNPTKIRLARRRTQDMEDPEKCRTRRNGAAVPGAETDFRAPAGSTSGRVGVGHGNSRYSNPGIPRISPGRPRIFLGFYETMTS